MSTSLRIDTTELFPDSLVIGDPGHGVMGSSVPSAGTHGPAFAFDSVILQPGFANKEYRGTLDAIPQGLTLVAYEDTSFTATGPAGSYVLPWTLYEDGFPVGASSFTLIFS